MKNIFVLMLIAILLVSCQSSQWKQGHGILEWTYADLRVLDPSDAEQPELDLIALYARINEHFFQMRIDFLDLGSEFDKDIYIPIDTNPGGMTKIAVGNKELSTDLQWDYLIKILASRDIEIIDDQFKRMEGLPLFIVRDPSQGGLIISIDQNILPISLGRTILQVIVSSPNQNNVIDKSSPFSIDAPSPSRVKMLFVFWNTFKASTPAQTLRSWAGAHAGPMSSRHGLRYLLEAAKRTKSTVFLLDLLNPDNLSALDYIGALPQIQQMVDLGYLVVPGCLEVNRFNKSFISECKAHNQSDFVLLLNSFVMLNNGDLVFGGNDYAQYNNCQFTIHDKIRHANTDSLPVDCKKLWITLATRQPAPLSIMGGDFANSTLGDPSVSLEVFLYIKAHPWIQLLTFNDLIDENNLMATNPPPYPVQLYTTGVTQSKNETGRIVQNISSDISNALQQAPDNPITKIAWNVYDLLNSPLPPDSSTIRSNYIGQIGEIISAAYWAEKPSNMQTCDNDLDYDGEKECILANQSIYAIIEPEGGYISFLFTMDQQGMHQIIGPTWQFLVGLSDPSTWDPMKGVRSDSSQILGAFSDPFDNWNLYSTELFENVINLINENMSIRKTLIIYPNKIHISIQDRSPSAIIPYIPLVVDPWLRYSYGWGNLYTSSQTPFIFNWNANSEIKVSISSANQLHAYPFNATHSALSYPEDPNFDYSRGHYLPYPMALVEILPGKDYSVDIRINP